MTDIDALNRDFAKYDQVEKAHTYRLAEHESDAFDEDYEIATLDFEPFLRGDTTGKARFADAFGTALHEIGFAVLTGHGVDPALYDAIHDAVIDLFTSTPLADKMHFRAQRHGSVSQGYFPLEETSDIHPDLVEGWLWCRRAFDVPQERESPFRADLVRVRDLLDHGLRRTEGIERGGRPERFLHVHLPRDVRRQHVRAKRPFARRAPDLCGMESRLLGRPGGARGVREHRAIAETACVVAGPPHRLLTHLGRHHPGDLRPALGSAVQEGRIEERVTGSHAPGRFQQLVLRLERAPPTGFIG